MSGHRLLDDDDGSVDVLDDLIDRALTTSWRRDGVCAQYKGLGAGLWFPEDRASTIDQKEQVALAIKLCRTCPVLDLCRTASLVNKEEFGVWGCLDERTRKNVLKQGPDATRVLLLEGVEQAADLRREEAATSGVDERAA